MDSTQELLESIYKNSGMGITSCEKLKEKKLSVKMLTAVKAQYKEYMEIHKEAKDLLHANNNKATPIGKMAELGVDMSIDMKTFMDKSNNAVAEMLIKGNTIGIIEITKSLKKCKTADKESIELANKLLKTEQNNIENMKNFLE